MRPFRTLALGTVTLLAMASQADAGWQSVFQVTCFNRSTPAVSNYSSHYADPCNPCPQKVCTTRYVQRCAYEPVTTYQSRSYYEPVTTYRTSYYYEPVTSYRYTCQYDPCTCSYRQVATPCTSYRLKSQCCPVQSWVQRCCSVPVTTYRQSFYWEPQTSCSYQDPCATKASAYVPPAYQPPAVTEQQTPPAVPNVQEYRDNNGNNNYQRPAVPNVQEYRNNNDNNNYQRPAVPAPSTLDGSNSSYRYHQRYGPLPQPQQRAITPKPERIAQLNSWKAPARLTGTILPE